LSASTCRKETTPIENYFECDAYDYFKQTEPYIYTPSDSIKLVNYLLRTKQFQNDTARMKYLFDYLSAYIPTRIFGTIDTALFDTYFLPHTGYKNFDFNNTISLIDADAVFVGEVVEVNKIKDTTKCLFFKTQYSIKVLDVLHSYFPLKKNDRILAGDIMGYTGGCTPGEDLIEVFTDFPEYHKGDKAIFLPSSAAYNMLFVRKVKYGNDYEDEYCPHFFRLFDNFATADCTDKKLLNDIKSLFNQ
jgi:hypothetical protein